MARALVDSGADGLTLINTYPALRIDIETRRPALGWGSGGLSGPALKPIALKLVYDVARAVDVPIVGCGGITSGEDAIEFMMAGASAVQVGTATFTNPHAVLDVLDGIEAYMRSHGIEDTRELVGVALPANESAVPASAPTSG